MNPVTFFIPIRTGRGLNDRDSKFVRHERVKRERKAAWACWPRRNKFQIPVVVKMVRIGPWKRPLDDDNLRGSLKAIRDQVAAELHVDDGDKRSVRWDYDQERGKWGVRVEISPLRAHPAACDDPYCCPMGGAQR